MNLDKGQGGHSKIVWKIDFSYI